jgi:hypothetical protein
MKPTLRTVLVALCVLTGGCATTATGAGSVQGPGTFASSAQAQHTAASRGSFSAVEAPDREPTLSARMDRGIPMPEPARDPSMREAPTPQVPIPATPEHRFGPPTNSAYVY